MNFSRYVYRQPSSPPPQPTRYFPNPYPDYNSQSNASIKDLVDFEFWTEFIRTASLICMEKLNTHDEKRCENGIYSGNLGLIFMAYKLLNSGRFQSDEMNLKRYMYECIKINEEFHSYNNIEYSRDISFLTGKGGLYVMGVFVSKTIGLDMNAASYINSYNYISSICRPIYFLENGADELFVGRAGYLNGYLVLKKYLRIESISKQNVYKICKSMIKSGRNYSRRFKSPCALMYAYHDIEYMGASHGLAGILQVLLGFRDYLEDHPDAERDVKNSVDYILHTQKTDGNFPIVLYDNMEEKKELIHWCHGAGGIVFLMGKAYLYWKEEKYLNACVRCGELIWQKGLLKKGPSLCHGIGGQGYVHLLLYRLTKDTKYLYRASKFAEFLLTDEFKNEPRKLDAPFSLFDGLGGAICFLIDLMDPDKADFPLMPVFDSDPEIANPNINKSEEINSKEDRNDENDDDNEDKYKKKDFNEKEQSSNKSEEEPKQEPKQETKQEPEQEPKQEPKKEPKKESNQELRSISKLAYMPSSRQTPIQVNRPTSRQTSIQSDRPSSRQIYIQIARPTSRASTKQELHIPRTESRAASRQELKEELKNEDKYSNIDYSQNDKKTFEITLQELLKDLSELNKTKSKLNELVEHLIIKLSQKKRISSLKSKIKIKLEKKETSNESMSSNNKLVNASTQNKVGFYSNLLNYTDRPKNKKVRFFEFAEQLPKRDWILIKSSNSNLEENQKSLQKTK